MAAMQALTFHGARDVRVEEVPRPEIEESGDVLLRVDRAAICGTDLHPYSGRMELEDGFVLGHEYLGTIEAKGDGVTEFEEGERVVGSFFVACGKCWFCRRGLPMKCMAIRVFGMGFAMGDLPGAQAQFLRVPEADLTLRKIPAEGALGAGKVVAVDLVPERLKLAESLGAIAVNPNETDPDDVVLDLTEWRGAD